MELTAAVGRREAKCGGGKLTDGRAGSACTCPRGIRPDYVRLISEEHALAALADRDWCRSYRVRLIAGSWSVDKDVAAFGAGGKHGIDQIGRCGSWRPSGRYWAQVGESHGELTVAGVVRNAGRIQGTQRPHGRGLICGNL